MTKWQRMWERRNSQEVGLEAAIFQRKRNSSLVERTRAENSTGLSHTPKLRDVPSTSVGEYCLGGEGVPRGALERRQELMLA